VLSRLRSLLQHRRCVGFIMVAQQSKIASFPPTDLLPWAVFRKMIVPKVTAGFAKVKSKNENRVA
jgi:hypothetical protein